MATCGLTALVGMTGTVLAADAPAPNTDWVSSAGMGLSLTRGNSRTVLLTGNAQAERKWDQNELTLGASGGYGTVHNNSTGKNDKNNDYIGGFAQYNRLIDDRWYGYLRLDGLHDDIADIDYRLTLSPGLGYYFIKNDTTTLSGEVGPGFVTEKLGGNSRTYMTLRVAEKFTHKINDRARIWQTAEYLPKIDKFSDYVMNFEIGIEADLTKKLALRSTLSDTFRNRPAAGRLKNDLKLVTGLNYKF